MSAGVMDPGTATVEIVILGELQQRIIPGVLKTNFDMANREYGKEREIIVTVETQNGGVHSFPRADIVHLSWEPASPNDGSS